MEHDDRQFERIARWLDGENVQLSPEELAEAEVIRRDLATMDESFDVPVPRELLDRVNNRMLAELARPAHRTNWKRRALSAAAAAGAVLIAFASLSGPGRPIRNAGPLAGASVVDVPIEVVAQTMDESARNVDLDALSRELDALSADISALKLPIAGGDIEAMQTEALEKDIKNFWLDDPLICPLEG